MDLKISSIIFISVIFFTSLPKSDEFEIRTVWNKITTPVKNIFKHDHNSDSDENSLDSTSRESGNFDNIGRDIVRGASKTITGIKNGLKETFSRDTQGLDCNKTFSNGVDDFKSKIRAIYPGTKWCGDGNKARSFSDLGRFSSTDSCCREHDLCPSSIPASEEKFGLKNTGLFTRSHCDCDKKFYDCLKEAKSIVADSIGYTYFTILGPQCFEESYPVVRCTETRKGKCVNYMRDTWGEKRYQWFDSPPF